MASKNIYHTVEVIEYTKYYSFEELCRVSSLDETWVRELLDYEVIKSENDSEKFSSSQLNIIMRAHRLQRDLELNIAGVALAIQLLDTIEQQEQELTSLRYQNRIIE